jgi:ATP-dependent Lon protease
MDETHHGMDTIKDLILDYIATMQLQSSGGVERLRKDIIPSQVQYQNNPPQGMPNEPMGQEVQMGVLRSSSANAPVFLFLGLQGVGKTSIAKSIAQSMGRKFSRISLGAIGDVRTLRGSPRYSPDAEPGQIIKALVRCGTMNPVILLDEIEKSSGNKGLLSDIMAVLLEILDPEQNSTFVDHYIDYPVDLSNVFFICTANNLGGLSAALLDRVEVIRFTSYSDQEKEVIGKEYILPRVLKNLNISPEYIKIEEEVWPLIIRPVGFDAGIRQLERNITTIVRSAARMIVEGKPLPIVINSSNLTDYVLADQGPLS